MLTVVRRCGSPRDGNSLPAAPMPRSRSTAPALSSAARREQQKRETREKIVAAATKVLLREGVDGFSMRKLATQIGYTPTAIYFHFPDRESLLSEVVERQFLRFRDSFTRIAREPDPIERLRAMGLALIQFAVDHPAHYRCLFLVPIHNIPKGRLIEKGNPSQDCYALLHSTIAEALAQGRFLPQHRDSQLLAQVFFAGVHGLAALHLIKGDDDWIQWTDLGERSRVMVDGLLAGLCRAEPKLLPRTAKAGGEIVAKKAPIASRTTRSRR
jgi:AcrR family transcriptional regulator